MKKPICFLALTIVLLFNCGENLHFEEAQPSGFKALRNIPKPLQGTYMKKDSTFMVVTKKRVIERDFEELTEPLEMVVEELKKDENEEADWVISDSTATGFKIYSETERLSIHINYPADKKHGYLKWEKEEFRLGKTDVIKQHNDAYYFSLYRPQDNGWILRKAILEGDSLFIYKIKRPKEREALEALTPVKDHYDKDGEKQGWLINPSPDVLALLFDQYGERNSSYVRIK